jgi:hypothetical protein
MVPPFGVRELRAGIADAVRANPGAELVKISGYYPGVSLDVLPVDPARRRDQPLDPGRDSRRQGANAAGPAKLQIASPPKMPASVLSLQLKIAAYTHAAFAKRARAAGFHDAVSRRGSLTESSTQSFFLVATAAARGARRGADGTGDSRSSWRATRASRSEGRMLRELPGRAKPS